MSDKELLEIIERDLTPRAYTELVTYAQYILNSMYLWRRVDKSSVEGKTSEDFVKETILKIIDGTRKWNINNNPNLISALKGHIKSVINGTFRKKENRVTTKTLEPADEETPEIEIEDETPDNLTLIELKETVKNINSLIADEEELKEIVVCFEEGIYKRSEIAETLEIAPTEVTNRLKRLHRKVEELKENYFK